ncbi:MAG: integrase arm-type DNA-binding domain-containing protein [Pseudomonadota bacterium]
MATITSKLSDVQIRNLGPREKSYKVSDGNGLYLEVLPSGTKSWRFKYRFGEKEKRLVFGTYPEVSLKEARERTDHARRSLRDHIDPNELIKARKLAIIESSKPVETFELVALEWHAKQSKRWSENHASRVLARLQRDIFPEVGAKPIADLSTIDVLKTLQKVEDKGTHELAHRLGQVVNAVFRYAVQSGKITYNPASDIKGALSPKPPVKHRAAMTSRDEVSELLRKIESYDGEEITKLALKLSTLVFLRSEELRGGRWDEIDFQKKEWLVPAWRWKNNLTGEVGGGMKMKSSHIVPLSKQAIKVLLQIQELGLSDTLIFPSTTSGRGQIMSENTLLYALYRMGYRSRQTHHGFRTIASTILNASRQPKWSADAIERQLAHSPEAKNPIRDAYLRHEFIDERTEMMQWYADELDRISQGATILNFRKID